MTKSLEFKPRLYHLMYCIARAAIVIYHRVSGLNNKYLLPHGSRGQSRGVCRVSFSWGLSPWSADGWLVLCPHTALPPCVYVPGVSFSSYKDSSHNGLELQPLRAPFELNHLFKNLISKYGYILRYEEQRLHHMNSGGHYSAITLIDGVTSGKLLDFPRPQFLQLGNKCYWESNEIIHVKMLRRASGTQHHHFTDEKNKNQLTVTYSFFISKAEFLL